MVSRFARQKSLAVYHLHLGGPDGDAIEWRALLAPRFEARLKALGVYFAGAASEADVVVVTGLLLERNLNAALTQLAAMPRPSVLIAAGDNAINGGQWAKLEMPGLSPYPFSHYAEIHIAVPGNLPTPQALIAALVAASDLLSRPPERLLRWQED